MSERLADLRCAAIDEDDLDRIVEVTWLNRPSIRKRLRDVHGNTRVRSAFSDEWPVDAEGLGRLTVSVARRGELEVELAEATGMSLRRVRNRLERQHGATRLDNAFPELEEPERPEAIPSMLGPEDEPDEVEEEDDADEGTDAGDDRLVELLGSIKISAVREPLDFVDWLAGELRIELAAAHRRVRSVHGAMQLKNVFFRSWPPDGNTPPPGEVLGPLPASALLDSRSLAALVGEVAGVRPSAVVARARAGAPGATVADVVLELGVGRTATARTKSAPPPPSSRPGEALLDGRYRLGRKLGAGSFGKVYEAERIHPPRSRVVIKLGTGLAKGTDVGSLQQEMGVAYGLNHQNICAYKDIGFDRKRGVYLVLAHGGQSLEQIIEQKGVVELERAVAITAHAAAGLDYAHRKGVIHHDVKPANILVDDSDGQLEVRVADFGIALKGRVAMNTAGKHTVIGTIPQGHTKPYAAPEQLRSEKSKKASDQYSLALVFCSMLEGEVFDDRYDRRDFARLSRAQNRALARALDADPDARFESCAAFAQALAWR